jgi:hypothetical protein
MNYVNFLRDVLNSPSWSKFSPRPKPIVADHNRGEQAHCDSTKEEAGRKTERCPLFSYASSWTCKVKS